MASNFRIDRRRNGEGLHLKLKGDFDGTSAHELVKVIREVRGRTGRLFVHTDNLCKVLPFACGIFKSRFTPPIGRPESVTFTGRFAGEVAPAGARII